jgi:pimeloyl-ACP methyl ester carboxylesterase
MFSLIRGRAPAIRSATGRSIATLEAVRLGATDQWLTIRGRDRSNPLLLFVHGGPGISDMGAIRHFLPALEEHFTVAHWSQRGAVKSYSSRIPAESMTVGQFVDDLESLIRHLLQRFGHRKLFLAGQSWGTLLCMRLVRRAPELVSAYVGVNQVVDRAEEELRSYRAVLERARERGNRKAVAELAALGEPKGGLFCTLSGTLAHKTWIRKLDMITHDPKCAVALAKAVALSPELTVRDILNMPRGLAWSMELLWREFCQANLFEEIPEVAVPVCFVAGQYDKVTNPELQAHYLHQLQAPRKEYVLFERSGHAACYEEPERFQAVMLKLLRENDLPGD